VPPPHRRFHPWGYPQHHHRPPHIPQHNARFAQTRRPPEPRMRHLSQVRSETPRPHGDPIFSDFGQAQGNGILTSGRPCLDFFRSLPFP
jgi:hypothetical protein